MSDLLPWLGGPLIPAAAAHRDLRRWIFRNGVALAAVVLLAMASRGLGLEVEPAIWFPTGASCALALLWGWRVLPGLWLGAVLAQSLAHPGEILVAGAQGSLASLEPLLVMLLVPYLLPQRDVLGSMRQLALFLLAVWLGGHVYTLLSSFLLPQGGSIPPGLSRLTGLLSVAPLVVAFANPSPAQRWGDWKGWKWWALLTAMVLAWALIQGGWVPALRPTPLVLILPLLVLAAFLFQPPAITVLVLVLALIELLVPFGATAARFNGLGLTTMQRLVSYTQLMVLFVMVANQERRRMVANLETQARRLELAVEERTRELVAANARLQVLSQRDGLTGIANRRWFEQVLRREWLDARRQAAPIAVLLLDVDHFKLYNDHYGHQAGDRVLRRVARSLASALRPGERHLLARYGGEEFVVLLPGLTNDDAARLAENLRAAVGSLAIVHGAWGSDAIVTISAGLASMVPAPGLSAAALVAAADSMLYAAKQAGRNRLCVHPTGPGP